MSCPQFILGVAYTFKINKWRGIAAFIRGTVFLQIKVTEQNKYLNIGYRIKFCCHGIL